MSEHIDGQENQQINKEVEQTQTLEQTQNFEQFQNFEQSQNFEQFQTTPDTTMNQEQFKKFVEDIAEDDETNPELEFNPLLRNSKKIKVKGPDGRPMTRTKDKVKSKNDLNPKLQKEYEQAKEMIDKLIKSSEELEKKYEPPKSKGNLDFLTKIKDIDESLLNQFGIDTEKFIHRETIYSSYKVNDKPNEDILIDLPTQLVLLNHLNKLFNFQFLQITDTNINFTHLDMSICKYLKIRNEKKIKTDSHKLTYIILSILLKKLMICSMTSIEQPLRSNSNWIKNREIFTIDKMITTELPLKLRKSFEIFFNELQSDYVYNDVSKINYLIHTLEYGQLEQTLSRVIKCMTPTFIYDYYTSIKSVYLFCALLECLINDNKLTPENLQLIGQISFMIYQNQVYKQNSKPRLLPTFEEDISNEYQMYYLNHTLSGPQIYMVKMLSESAESLKEVFKK